MQIIRQPFGKTQNGETVDLFTLINNSGSRIKICNYGGIITDIILPDRNGKMINVVLGFDKLEDYYSKDYKRLGPYFGAIVGRYANRIREGSFVIDGITYSVPRNIGRHALHGGIEGFDKKMWKAELTNSENEVGVRFSYQSAHLEEGYPGNLRVEVKYTWNDKNELCIAYTATTDLPTHLNLTNHSYFNLNGGVKDVLNTQVKIDADTYTEVDEDAIPTGNFSEVGESNMDFRKLRLIGESIETVEGTGYDHNYVLNNYNGNLNPVAEAIDPDSGIKLEVLTTEPGLQFFTANHLDGSISRGDIPFTKRSGFCFETQHFPDSPNQPAFPTTLLRPGEEFKSTTVYKFSTATP